MKKLFFATAAVLMFAIAYHVGATGADAQATTKTSSVSQPNEVAVLTGVVPDGGTIPLPNYADGTQALESECQWFVSINALAHDTAGIPHIVRCFTTGRIVSAFWCMQTDCSAGTVRPGTANYMIIATRAGGPVSAQGATWGQVKSRYR